MTYLLGNGNTGNWLKLVFLLVLLGLIMAGCNDPPPALVPVRY